jgi:hypothetical protein
MARTHKPILKQTIPTKAVNTFTAILPNNPKKGAFYVLYVVNDSSATVSSVAQTDATWAKAVSNASGGVNAEIWYGIGSTTSFPSKRVTVTMSGAAEIVSYVEEYLNASTSTPLLNTASGTGTGSSGDYTGTAITPSADESFIVTLFGAAGGDGVCDITELVDGWSEPYGIKKGSAVQLACLSRYVGNARAVTPAFYNNEADVSFINVSAAFKTVGIYSDDVVDAFNRGAAEPRVLVEVHVGSPSESTTFVERYSDAPLPNLRDVYNQLVSVSSFRRDADTVSRKMRVSEVNVELALDSRLRYLYTYFSVIGSKVQIWLGTPDLEEYQFMPVFAGTIEDLIPGRGVLNLTCKSIEYYLLRQTIAGAWINRHPIQAAYDVLALKVPSQMIESDSFDPADNDDISHLVCDRGSWNIFGISTGQHEDISAGEIVEDFAKLASGMIVSQEDGRLRFVRNALGSSLDDTWTEHDVSDIEMQSIYQDDLFTRVVLNTHPDPQGNFKCSVSYDDLAGKPYFGFSGGAYHDTEVLADTEAFSRDTTLELSTGAVNGECVLAYDLLSDSVTSGTIYGKVYSMSGSGWPGYDTSADGTPTGTQPAHLKVSASRPAYWLLQDELWITNQRQIEVMKVTSMSVTGRQELDVADANYEGRRSGANRRVVAPYIATFSGATRGTLGTAAYAWPQGTIVHDITPAVIAAQETLRRHRWGVPVMRCTTSLAKAWIQLGDLVGIDLSNIETEDQPWVWWFGNATPDKLTAAVQWEVIGKEIKIHDGAPRVEWVLKWWQTDTWGTTVTDSVQVFELPSADTTRKAEIDKSENFTPFVTEGFGFTAGTFPAATLGAGVVCVMPGLRVEMRTDLALTLAATKDHYITYDASARAVVTRIETVGDPEPDFLPSETVLWKITTSASAVTEATDRRELYAYNGDKLLTSSIPGRSIDDSAVAVRHVETLIEQSGFIPNGDFSVWSLPYTLATHPPDGWYACETSSSTEYGLVARVRGTDPAAGSEQWGASDAVFYTTAATSGAYGIELDPSAISTYIHVFHSDPPPTAGTMYALPMESPDSLFALKVRYKATVATATAFTFGLVHGVYITSVATSTNTYSKTVSTSADTNWHEEVIVVEPTLSGRNSSFRPWIRYNASGTTVPLVFDSLKLFRIADSFEAYASGTTAVNAATWTQVTLAAESHDYGSNFASDTFTAPEDGEYSFNLAASLTSIATGTYGYLALYVNGALAKFSPRFWNNSGSSQQTLMNLSVSSINLTVGDTADMRVYFTSGAATTVGAGRTITSFSGKRNT